MPVGRANQWVFGRLIYPAVIHAVGEGVLFKRLAQLESFQWQPPEIIEREQRARLAELLRHAAARSHYYQGLLPGGRAIADADAVTLLGTLPLLTRAALQSGATEIAANPPIGRIVSKTTGGSTGQAVTVLKDSSALAFERAAMWLGYSWAGVRIGDKAARFWGTQFSGSRRLASRVGDFAMNRLRFSAFAFGEDDLEGYWRRCVEFKPAYLYGYVSMLEAFAAFLEQRGYDGTRIGARAVITTSEVLSPPQRDLLERVFGARVFVEYGCGEVGPIAYECERHCLHLLTSDLVIEVVDAAGRPAPPGENGQIVVTDLNSRAMPLVRYAIGDNGALGTLCACGRGFPLLAKIWGRAYDVVQGLDGRRFHGEFFMYLFEDLRREGHSIRQFQVVQDRRDHLSISVVADPITVGRIAPVLKERLAQHLAGIHVDVSGADAIERAKSGKMQVVRSLIVQGGGDVLSDSASAARRAQTIDVVVPVYNKVALLDAALGSLMAAAEEHGNVQVWLVDNGSTDGSFEFISERFAQQATVLRLPDATISSVRNHGARQGTAPTIAFLDCDCEIPLSYFMTLQRAIEDAPIDGTGCKVTLPPNPTWVESVWNRMHATGRSGDRTWINSANFVVRRELFERVGGFNDHLETGEDTEICLRIREAGGRLYEDKRLGVAHLDNAKTLKEFFLKERWRGLGMLGTVKGTHLDRPTTMTLMHLFALMGGLYVVGFVDIPIWQRLSIASLSLLVVPLLTVGYRRLGSSSSFRLDQAVVLYEVYYFGRIASLMVLIRRRFSRYLAKSG